MFEYYRQMLSATLGFLTVPAMIAAAVLGIAILAAPIVCLCFSRKVSRYYQRRYRHKLWPGTLMIVGAEALGLFGANRTAGMILFLAALVLALIWFRKMGIPAFLFQSALFPAKYGCFRQSRDE